jgi:predicted small metal-binding protein
VRTAREQTTRGREVARRRIVCSCGDEIVAANDDELFWKVRRHVDSEHRELNYSASDIREFIAREAVTI